MFLKMCAKNRYSISILTSLNITIPKKKEAAIATSFLDVYMHTDYFSLFFTYL